MTSKQIRERLEKSVKALAADIDSEETRPTARAIAARELRETLMVLQKVAPEKPKTDKLDELADKRDRRRAAS